MNSDGDWDRTYRDKWRCYAIACDVTRSVSLLCLYYTVGEKNGQTCSDGGTPAAALARRRVAGVSANGVRAAR